MWTTTAWYAINDSGYGRMEWGNACLIGESGTASEAPVWSCSAWYLMETASIKYVKGGATEDLVLTNWLCQTSVFAKYHRLCRWCLYTAPPSFAAHMVALARLRGWDLMALLFVMKELQCVWHPIASCVAVALGRYIYTYIDQVHITRREVPKTQRHAWS